MTPSRLDKIGQAVS